VGVLGGLDLAQPQVQRFGGCLVADGLVGCVGGNLRGQQVAPLGAEDSFGEELADGCGQQFLADRHAAGVRPGSGGGPVGVVGPPASGGADPDAPAWWAGCGFVPAIVPGGAH
jgi:hypothetical protein